MKYSDFQSLMNTLESLGVNRDNLHQGTKGIINVCETSNTKFHHDYFLDLTK